MCILNMKSFISQFLFVLFLYAGVFKESFNEKIDLAVLSIILLLLIILVDFIKRPEVTKSIQSTIVIFSILLILVLISVSFNPSTEPFVKLSKLIALTAPAVVVPFFIIKTKADFFNFLWAVLVLSSILALISLPQALTGDNMFVGFNERNYQGLARVLGVGFLSSLLLFVFLNDKKIKFLLTLVLVLNGVMLFFAGSRMPIIAVAISLLVPLTKLAAFKNGDVILNKKSLKIAIMYISLFVAAIIFVGKGLFDTILIRFQQLLDMGSSSNVGRTERYSLAWDLFSNNPLTGIGFGRFGEYYMAESGNYAHNILLELASELGLLGFLWAVFYFLMLFIKSLKSFEYSNKLATIYVVVFLYTVMNAMVSGDINDNRVMFSIGSIICLLANSRNDAEQLFNDNLKNGKVSSESYKDTIAT